MQTMIPCIVTVSQFLSCSSLCLINLRLILKPRCKSIWTMEKIIFFFLYYLSFLLNVSYFYIFQNVTWFIAISSLVEIICLINTLSFGIFCFSAWKTSQHSYPAFLVGVSLSSIRSNIHHEKWIWSQNLCMSWYGLQFMTTAYFISL